jgi:hypothetical protein
MSGYSPVLPDPEGGAQAGPRVLEKPFSADVLLKAIRESLDATADPP